MPNLDDAIATVEAAGMSVIRHRDDPDTQLRQMFNQVCNVLRMAQDIAADGARLYVPAWPYNPDVDAVKLTRDGVVRMVDNVLKNAVVEREEVQHAAE